MNPEYTYTLTYDANGGSGGPAQQTYGPTTDTSHTFTIPETEPTRENYSFIGWAASSDSGGALWYPGETITVYSSSPSYIVYAVWALLPQYTYSLTYNANGGTDAPSQQTYGPTYDTSHVFEIVVPTPTRSGYTFEGWATSSTGPAEYQPGGEITVNSTQPAVTLFAVWEELPQYTYTLTYDANGGSGAPAQQSYGPTYDTSYTFTISSTTPTWSGYTFEGWATSSSGSVAYQPGGEITVNSTQPALILYAIWEAIPTYTYTITYNANGGSGAPDAQSFGPTTETSHQFTLSSDTPTRTNFTFEGWATSSSGSVEYQPGGSLTLQSGSPSITLFAVWEELPQYTFTLIYNVGAGSGAPEQQTYGPTYETSHQFTISETEPTWSGYTFDGWATSSGGSVEYDPGDSVTLQSSAPSLTLFAVWTEIPTYTYTVSYNANGGSGAPDTQSFGPTTETSHQFTLSSETPTLEGNTFEGWATSSSGSVEYQPGGSLTLQSGSPSITLFAVWEEIPPTYTYTITYNANGGSGAPAQQSFGPTEDTSHQFTLSSDTPTWSGYTFEGWATSSTGSVEYQPGGSITLQSGSPAITLYAIWEAIPTYTYTVSYNANGGTDAPSQQTYGPTTETSHQFTLSSDTPTLEGSTFQGWATSSGGSVAYQPGGSLTLQSGSPAITLYAVWEEVPTYTYTITYNANGGSGAPDTQSFGPTTETSHQFTLSQDEPTRTNFTFEGWATSSGGSVAYDPGDSVTLQSSAPSLTLFAVWKELPQYTYTLIYNVGAGSGAPAQQTYGPTYETSHQFTLSQDEPTRTNFTFEGWATESGGSVAYQPGGEITAQSTQPTVTLFAVWEEIPTYTYVLTFNANGGTGAPIQQSYGPTTETSHRFIIPRTMPVWEGYEFAGWNTSIDGTGTAYQPGSGITVTSEDVSVTLYAIWTTPAPGPEPEPVVVDAGTEAMIKLVPVIMLAGLIIALIGALIAFKSGRP